MLLFMAETLSPSQRQRLTDMYEKYSRRMFTAAKRILNDDHAAEDAVQNAFVSVAKKMHLVNDKDEDALCGYLFAVVKNESYLILRRTKQAEPLDTLPDLPSGEDTEFEVSERDAYEHAVSLLMNMDDAYRAPLFLNVVMGYSTKETAEVLKRPESTVRVQISRAKHMLAQQMKEAGYES